MGAEVKTFDDSIHLGGSTWGSERHACAFFNDRDEEYALLLPFMREGIERGDRAFHIVDPAQETDHRGRLEAAGIPVGAAEERGQLEVRTWDEAYMRGGYLDRDAMIELVEDVLSRGKAAGYRHTRFIAHVQWTLAGPSHANDLLEYEARLGEVLARHDDPVICVYDSMKLGAGVALDILRTHPVAILGGVVHNNPFFVLPDELLRELRLRDERATGH
jgi:hypothetical protein